MLADLIQPKLQDRPPPNQVVWKEKKKRGGIRMGLAPLKGSCERGKVPLHWKPPSLAGRSAGTDKELQRLTGEWGRWLVAGRAEREQLRRSLSHHCTSQPKRHICWYVQQLGAETQASVDRPGDGTPFGCAEKPKRPGVWSGLQMGVCTACSLGPPQKPYCQCTQEGRGVA